MKTASLILPVALLAVIAAVMLSGRSNESEHLQTGDDGEAPVVQFEEFVQTVGLDASAMSTGLRREALISGRQRSLPLCVLSEKQADNGKSPLEIYAAGVGVDVSNLQRLNADRQDEK